MNKFSNVLKIPTFSDLYKDFINEIALASKTYDSKSDAPMFEKKLEDIDSMNIDTPMNWGVTALYEEGKYQLKSVNEIDSRDELFVLHVNVMSIFPENVSDYVLTLEDGSLYYNVALICREGSHSNKMITLYLSSYDQEGEKFFGIPPVDFHKSTSQLNKLKTVVKKLTQPDCFVSVLVQAVKPKNSESDRIYRIIGEYQNNL